MGSSGTGPGVDDELDRLVADAGDRLRPPELVMSPETLGAARLTRYSFNRSMLRTAVSEGWTARRVVFDMDATGQGEAVYEVDTGDQVFSFVAFTRTLDESEHTDRVIADRWEITAGLVEGAVDDDLMAMARSELPRQEGGRLDARFLVLTRGNRSVRFFDYLVEVLSQGHQPDPDLVADSGYIMRSTAFYGNGKFGMRSFDGYRAGHPFAVPYRAQFVCAWLYRELSYDVVEHCAHLRGGARAVGFDEEWRRFFGLGNATGLGLVPYAFKHPRVIHTWTAVRELALAEVVALDGRADRVARLRWWIERAERHFSTGADEDCTPFRSPRDMAATARAVREAFDECSSAPRPFRALLDWAHASDAETHELVVSLLIELHDGDDALMDRLLIADEHPPAAEPATVGELSAALTERFGWIDELDLRAPGADGYWWVVSDNTEEPRRVLRDRLAPEGRDVAIDIAHQISRLRDELRRCDDGELIARFLVDRPEHTAAVQRVIESDRMYGEPRDNACALTYLPLQLQRFQLAMYGMDNFKPKSTDWLRVTLFQGAPRVADLASGDPSAMADNWVFPPRPSSIASTASRIEESR